MIAAAILATAIPWMLIVLDRTGGQVTGDPAGASAPQQRSPDAATHVPPPDAISSTATPEVTQSSPAASNLKEAEPDTTTRVPPPDAISSSRNT